MTVESVLRSHLGEAQHGEGWTGAAKLSSTEIEFESREPGEGMAKWLEMMAGGGKSGACVHVVIEALQLGEKCQTAPESGRQEANQG